jgi:syntaxin-binding protein 5
MSHTNEVYRALNVDTSGDFIAFKRDFKSNLIKEIILSSLFDIRRAYGLPDVDFVSTSREVPSQPKPISAGPVGLLSGTLSWLGGGGGMTGDQVDALCMYHIPAESSVMMMSNSPFIVAGPDRPMPEAPKVQSTATGPSTAARLSAEAQSAQSNLYARLSSALNDRG